MRREAKPLLGGIDVVEVEVDDAPVIAADGAPSASLVEKHPAHTLLATRHGLANATATSPLLAVSGVEPVVIDASVSLARTHVLRRFDRRSGPAAVDHVWWRRKRHTNTCSPKDRTESSAPARIPTEIAT